MFRNRPSPIARAIARMLAETRHSPVFRQILRNLNELEKAAEVERAAGVWYGPAAEANRRYMMT